VNGFLILILTGLVWMFETVDLLTPFIHIIHGAVDGLDRLYDNNYF